jgi:hypothetical protein
MRRSRWALFGYLLVAICACGLLLKLYSGRRQGPFWQKFERVQLDMSDKDVEAILGPPDDIDHFGGGTNGTYYYTWQDGEQKIVLTLNWDFTSRYHLTNKEFYPKSTWEKVKESPHDLWWCLKWNLPW